MPIVLTAFARVEDWEALRQLNHDQLLGRARAAGAARYRICRNINDAAQVLVLAELPDEAAARELLAALDEQLAGVSESVWEPAGWEEIAASQPAGAGEEGLRWGSARLGETARSAPITQSYFYKGEQTMSTEQSKALFRRFVEEVANQGKLAAADELVAADFVDHEELPPNIPPGIEGVKAFFAEWRQGFPDGRVAIEMEIAEGDRLAVYQVWRGTHTGSFMGIPPSGKPVNFKAVDIVRIAGGKLVEHWAVTDSLALMQQIGAVPDSSSHQTQ